MPAILELKNLSLLYRDKLLVDNISFQLSKGKILGIVGESGSGKSLTALSIISLLPRNIRVSSGEIWYLIENSHVDLLSLEKETIRSIRGGKISMIFQEPMTCLNPSMRCGLQIEETIRAHCSYSSSEIRDKVMQLLDEVRLPRPSEIYKAYPHQLSGGQRQRLMIAMALSAGPEIIIADEPTTALDVTVQKSITDLLRQLTIKLNLSLIFISHNLPLVRELAEDVVVMRYGQIVEKGPVTQVYLNPVNPYTKGLLACQPYPGKKPFRLMTIQDFERGTLAMVEDNNPEKNNVRYDKEPLLRIENLSVEYNLPGGLFPSRKRSFRALYEVSFQVYKGEILGLVGESGCGKTTIGKTILRLLRNSEGKIWYKGKNLAELKRCEMKEFRRSVQVVFQDPFSSLNPQQKIKEIFDEAMAFHHPGLTKGERSAKIIEILVKVGLSGEDLDKYPHQFSGGQRQRICIARSLTPEPELLILDESVSALDVSVQAQVLNLLRDLKDTLGLTYVFISHDLSVVRYMSDRIIVMKEGKIVESGFAEQIFIAPENEYTSILIQSVPGYQNSI